MPPCRPRTTIRGARPKGVGDPHAMVRPSRRPGPGFHTARLPALPARPRHPGHADSLGRSRRVASRAGENVRRGIPESCRPGTPADPGAVGGPGRQPGRLHRAFVWQFLRRSRASATDPAGDRRPSSPRGRTPPAALVVPPAPLHRACAGRASVAAAMTTESEEDITSSSGLGERRAVWTAVAKLPLSQSTGHRRPFAPFVSLLFNSDHQPKGCPLIRPRTQPPPTSRCTGPWSAGADPGDGAARHPNRATVSSGTRGGREDPLPEAKHLQIQGAGFAVLPIHGRCNTAQTVSHEMFDRLYISVIIQSE